MATQLLEIVIRVVDRATQGIKNVEKSVKNVDKNLKSATSSARNFMGIAFGMLFFGMALNRIFSRALNSIIDLTKISGAETSVFNIKTQELAASWEFFKFTIKDALGQSELFVNMIDLVISLINWFAELSPTAKIALVTVMIGAVLATGAIMFLGQVFLVLIGISMAFGISMGVAAIALGLVFLAFVILAAAVVALVAVWNSDMPFIKKLLLSVLIVLVAVSLVFGFWIALIAAAVTAVIILAVRWGGFANLFKATIGGMILVGASFIDFFMNKWIEKLNIVIDLVNAIVRVFNRVTGSSIGQIDHSGFVSNQRQQAEDFLANSPFFADAVERGQEIESRNEQRDNGLLSRLAGNNEDSNSRLDKIIDLLDASGGIPTPDK